MTRDFSSRIVPAQEGYDRWSALYDVEDNPLITLDDEHVRHALGRLDGLQVLDLGCGTGRHALSLARAGAHVTAVDFSEGMLRQARSKPEADKVRFVEHDISSRLPFENGAFDRVLCCLALEHIADLRAVFSEMKRLCHREGLIVVSDMHPAMWLKGVSAHFHDPETGQDIRPASVGNQISDYVMGALGVGLMIERIAEFAVTEELASRSSRAAKHVGWPLLLLMTLRPAAEVQAG